MCVITCFRIGVRIFFIKRDRSPEIVLYMIHVFSVYKPGYCCNPIGMRACMRERIFFYQSPYGWKIRFPTRTWLECTMSASCDEVLVIIYACVPACVCARKELKTCRCNPWNNGLSVLYLVVCAIAPGNICVCVYIFRKPPEVQVLLACLS